LYSERLLDHFENPRNPGELDGVRIHVVNPACGDELEWSVLVREGRIARSAFRARGCPAAMACASALTVWAEGRALTDLDNAAASIELEVGGLPPASRHAAALCADAVRQLRKTTS